MPIIDAITSADEVADNPVLNIATGVLRPLGSSGDLNVAIMAVLAVAVSLFLLSGGFALLHQYLTAAIPHRLRRETKSSLFERLLYARYENASARNREETLHDINVPADAVYSTIRHLVVLFKLLTVRVRRNPSRKFDNLLGGKVWLDGFVLAEVDKSPRSDVQSPKSEVAAS